MLFNTEASFVHLELHFQFCRNRSFTSMSSYNCTAQTEVGEVAGSLPCLLDYCIPIENA